MAVSEGKRLIDGMFNDEWFCRKDRLSLKHAFDEKNREAFLGKSEGRPVELSEKDKQKVEDLVRLGVDPATALKGIVKNLSDKWSF